MGNLCFTASAGEPFRRPAVGPKNNQGLIDLNAEPATPTQPRAQQTQMASRSATPPPPSPASAASKASDGPVARVEVKFAGTKFEQMAVGYLQKEVGQDRVVHNETRGQEDKVEDAQVADIADQEEHLVTWQQGELIGAGAFGRVYLGLNLDTGQLMAVKQVSIARDEAVKGQVAQHVKSLEAEVSVLKQLHHPNIVRYLGTERVHGDISSLNIFLEYVPGGSIASLLAKFGRFTENVLRVYTKQILLGLEFLHTHQIMHRDIKGANILVDNTGVVKLADFGASKKIEDLVTMDSGFKSIKGTPYWMAPEVIKQTGHGRQADIWSVGCTVIEMATGKPPWSEYAQPVSALFKIASSNEPPPIPENLSPEAKDFLLLCFNRVPKDRPNATRLLQHPFLSAPMVTRRPPPAKIAASVPGNIPRAASSTPQPPPPSHPPPAIGTGFRFVGPAKPLSPVVEAHTPPASSRDRACSNLGRGPEAANDRICTATTKQPTPSRSPEVDFFGTKQSSGSGNDPMMDSAAFTVDSIMSYNPIEEPSWMQSQDSYPSSFLMHGGLPPPQPLSLYEEKENCGESSAHPVPLELSDEPVGLPGDVSNIMTYVREKAVQDFARLSSPFTEQSINSMRSRGKPSSMNLQGPANEPSPTSLPPPHERRAPRPVRSQNPGDRAMKSRQWEAELELELKAERARVKTPR